MQKRLHSSGGKRSVSAAERKEQSAAAQKAQLEHYQKVLREKSEKAQEKPEEKPSRLVRDATVFDAALSQMPLLQIGTEGSRAASITYRQVVKSAINAMNTGANEAILCWPSCNLSPAAIVALLSLADCAIAAPIRVGGYDALSAPNGIRALFYPYARSVHRPLKHIYIDRNYIGEIQLRHQVRATQQGENPALADFHKTLVRVRKLTGLALDGKEYPEFANPCMDEVLPSGPCKGTEARSELLWHVRSKTDLKSISRTGDADNPAKARFYLFGLRPSEEVRSSLRALTDPLDIILLQLDYTGRNRLGRDWLTRVRNFVDAAQARFEAVPIVAITDDPWTFDRLRFDCLAPKQQKKTRIPSASSIVLAQNSDITAANDAAHSEYKAIEKCEVIAFAGKSGEMLRRLKSARKEAINARDEATAELLSKLSGVVGRCAALPGSRARLTEYIEKEEGVLKAADIMTAYRIGGLIGELRQSNGPWPQLARAQLLALCDDLEKIWANTNESTPMAPLLKDVVKRFRNVSSRTAILFSKDLLADFAAEELCKDVEIGERVSQRLENRMLRFMDRAGLDDLDNLPRAEKNHIKTLIVVAATRSALLSLLAKPWLPDFLIVLGDAATLESAARDTQRLVNFPQLKALSSRMAAFTAAAVDEIGRVRGAVASLDQFIEPSEDIDIPTSAIVNLVGHIKPDQTICRFELDGGQILLCRPGTKLVVQEASGIIPVFAETEARAVEEGDRVCAIGDAFLEMARPLLNITLRAAEEIRDYHKLVLEKFAAIPGANVTERLTNVVQKMNLANVKVQRARYWVSLEEQLDVPLDDVVPHAPLDLPTFVAFMSALSVSEAMARRYWIWAVIAQRSNRMRAGQSIRDAYRAILVDNYAAQSDNPERIRDVKQLRAAAENFVAAVRSKAEMRGDDVRS